MATRRYAALLRGINVGGRNKVPMAELRETLEGAGFSAVRTYIQSGNVLFESAAPRRSLEDSVEVAIEERFGFPVLVVVRSHTELRAVVEGAPAGFGQTPDLYRSDAIFLKAPLSPDKAMEVVQLRDEVDQVWSGKGVLYFARLSERREQSRLSRLVGTPQYKLMTVRNWATTTKLLGLLDAPT